MKNKKVDLKVFFLVLTLCVLMIWLGAEVYQTAAQQRQIDRLTEANTQLRADLEKVKNRTEQQAEQLRLSEDRIQGAEERLQIQEEKQETTAGNVSRIYYTMRKARQEAQEEQKEQEAEQTAGKNKKTAASGTHEATGASGTPGGMTLLGTYELTAYEATGNPCANGNYPTVGYTAASNTIPIGTRIYIEGVGERVIEDTGGMAGNVIDVYLGDPAACIQFGRWSSTVYIVN